MTFDILIFGLIIQPSLAVVVCGKETSQKSSFCAS